MRIFTAVFVLSFALPLGFAACGSSNNPVDDDPFDTLQDCYDEHHNMESLSVHDALVVCCIDHPIAGVKPSCGNTEADCETHVRANIDASVTSADITAVCTTYIMEK